MFKKTALLRARFVKAVSLFNEAVSNANTLILKNPVSSAITSILRKLPMTTTRRLAYQIAFGSLVLLVITSISPYSITEAQSFDPELDGTYLIADQEGYLIKSNPVTLDGERVGMTDRVVHTVLAGETVSEIAAKYGLKSETLLWENNIYNPNSIKVGQKLVVPPVNGVTHKVAAGETLDKIAAKYKVEKDLIAQQNKLEDELIFKGQELLIPGGKAIESPYYGTRAYPARVDRYVSDSGLAGSDSAPVAGRPFIFPTRGKLTQGWRWGHYAFDIADTSKPPVWASAGGVVESASGGWGGGYGNHVVIDHGNGLKTLYAHLEYYSVQEGQSVSQGEVIGKMGRTGRVYGVTGIHLHFEVIKDGVKQYPGNYW